MIIDAIINLIAVIITGFINFLPSTDSLPPIITDINSSMEILATNLPKLNAIFPMNTLVSMAIISIILSIAMAGFHASIFIYNKIRGSG